MRREDWPTVTVPETTEAGLASALRAALRVPPSEGGDLALTAVLKAQHPADIAEALVTLTRPEALAVFNWLENARAAEVLDEIDPELVRYILDNAPPGRIVDLLDRLPMDDAAEVVAEATPQQAEAILADLSRRAPEDAEEVRELLSYPEGTAGRIMTDKFVHLLSNLTIEQAFTAVREADPEVETLTDLYVVEPLRPGVANNRYRLAGVLSLRELVRARPDRRIADIMTPEVVTVGVEMDQEEVARIISKYDFFAVPVIDREGALVGIVTVDDVVDVLVEEQTEDVLALGAVKAAETTYLATGVMTTVKQRFSWLLLLFVAETATGSVLRHFEDELSKAVALSFFVPLLIGSGGNAGAQTVTTITRALALGEVRFTDWKRVFWRETRVGLMVGTSLAIIGYFRALLWGTSPQIAQVVACALIVIVIWANMVGSLLPIAAKRLGFDPAVMSAPFITTLVDATGLYIYFSIARVILGL